MKLDAEADFEATVTALLRERADRAVVEPDMRSVTLGQHDNESVAGAASRWWLAVAAVVVAMAGVGLALGDEGVRSEPIGSAAEPDSRQAATTHDLIVWMEVGVESPHVSDLADLLASSASVDGFVYVDQAATWSEFVEYFADEPEIVALVDPENLPTSFKIQTDALGPVLQLVRDRPGVEEVEVATPGN